MRAKNGDLGSLPRAKYLLSRFFESSKKGERKEREEEEEERHTRTHKKKRALIFEKEKSRGATLGPVFHFLFFSLLFFGESKSLFFFAFVKTSFLTNLRQQRWKKKNNDTLFCERCFCLSFSPKSSLLKLSLQRRRQRRRRRKRATNAFFCLVILFDSDCVRILYISRRAEETYTHRERERGNFRVSHASLIISDRISICAQIRILSVKRGPNNDESK